MSLTCIKKIPNMPLKVLLQEFFDGILNWPRELLSIILSYHIFTSTCEISRSFISYDKAYIEGWKVEKEPTCEMRYNGHRRILKSGFSRAFSINCRITTRGSVTDTPYKVNVKAIISGKEYSGWFNLARFCFTSRKHTRSRTKLTKTWDSPMSHQEYELNEKFDLHGREGHIYLERYLGYDRCYFYAITRIDFFT